jgi:hypothetical protein
MARSCIMAGHAPAARAGRHSSCPIQGELSQAARRGNGSVW